jgi:hypothetical protein
MKRTMKTLSLHRETLHGLVREDLVRVAGGNTNEIVTSCMATKLCGTTGCGGGSAGCTGNSNVSCTRQIATCCPA